MGTIQKRLREGIVIIIGTTAMTVNIIEVDFIGFFIAAALFLFMWVYIGR